MQNLNIWFEIKFIQCFLLYSIETLVILFNICLLKLLTIQSQFFALNAFNLDIYFFVQFLQLMPLLKPPIMLHQSPAYFRSMEFLFIFFSRKLLLPHILSSTFFETVCYFFIILHTIARCFFCNSVCHIKYNLTRLVAIKCWDVISI